MIPKDACKPFQRILFMIITIFHLIVGPLTYIFLAYIVTSSGSLSPDMNSSETADLLFYVLLGFSIIGPSVYPIVEKAKIDRLKKKGDKIGSPFKVYKEMSLIKQALIMACYLYGLVLVFITYDMTYLWYFYPIGIVWTIIRWPTEEKYREFVRKLEAV